MDNYRVNLPQSEIPQTWYNVMSEFPGQMPPPYSPVTGKIAGPSDFTPIFPMEIIKQEMSEERYIEIPNEVRDVYKLWRPTPLHRAVNLEKALKTKTRIYYKNESVSAAGSHKLNTAIAQAYYNKIAGVKRIATETGAGQWGCSLAYACQLFGLECTVYMVKVSYLQKPYRKLLMHVWGADVHASPSNLTNSGREILAKDPHNHGNLGIAISEAVEDAATHEDTNYSLGSVLNHVLLHQSVIGLETKKQLEMIGEKPAALIACVGGGSNFGGFAFPFIPDKLAGKDIKLIAVEPSACPTLTKGVYSYDYGDTAKLAPIVKMFTLGHGFMPPDIHAGGLRYHGMSPIVSLLKDKGLIEAVSVAQIGVFEAAILFSKTEGMLPAPESAHAIKAAIDEAMKNEDKAIVFNLSGHGHFDLASYEAFLSGKLKDYEYPKKLVETALKDLPKVG